MALLVYSNGMDVRVATVPSGDIILHMNNEMDVQIYTKEVEWEYCGDDADYRKRCKELEEHTKRLEATVDLLQRDNFAMHQKILKAYGALK